MNRGQQPHSLARTLLFLLAVGGVCAVLMSLPLEWKRGDQVVFSFPRWSDWGRGDEGLVPEDVNELLDAYGGGSDSVGVATASGGLPPWLTSGGGVATAIGGVGQNWPPYLRLEREAQLRAREDSAFLPAQLHRNLRLAGDSTAWRKLWNFFGDMARLEPGDGNVHVLHYGDSQIEGDRITGELRRAWQQKWGGTGPGFVSGVPQVQHLAFHHEVSRHWNRETCFMQRKADASFQDFGLLGTRAQPMDTARVPDAPETWARMTFTPRNTGYKANRTWSELHVWTGPVAQETPIRIRSVRDTSFQLEGALPADADGLRWGISLQDRKDPLSDVVLEIGAPPPAIHAVGFWGPSGIVVHNIPMRGASGTLFRKLSGGVWEDQIRSLPVGMVVLQFGGNAVPSISDAASARRYAVGFGAQIALFRNLFPEVPIVVIGPSDMALKVGEQFETYPQLIEVRNQLKQVAREQHALYWDLFDVMGGERSMHAWVTSDPPLAGPDHIHFSPLGAKRVGELLVQAFEAEWGLWAGAVQRQLDAKKNARP